MAVKSRLLKHIYKHPNGWVVTKSINGKNKFFKSFKSLDEAISYRDQLRENDWKPLPLTEEEAYEEKRKEYYKYVMLSSSKNTYHVRDKKWNYLANIEKIEEALYYRDLFYDCPGNVPKPSEVDLVTDNPYYITGLAYPLLERLKKKEKDKRYGKGSIVQKSRTSYVVVYNRKRFCSCRTYEQAYYVRKELQACNWDKNEVQRILDDYPVWYTKLMHLYKYIMKNPQESQTSKWIINVPKEFSDNSIDRYNYRNIEDALFERDFLMNNNWDYNLLVECIDDNVNPYYDMELPPYPQRKIKKLSEIKTFTDELNQMRNCILEGYTRQGECAEAMDTSSVNLRNWLGRYNINWKDFVELVLSGEDIWTVLEFEEHIYQPDLSPSMPTNYKGYVQKNNSGRSPYCVRRKGIYYGAYEDEKTARRVVNELKKCNWDKKRLPQIQEKVGFKEFLNTKRWVYENSNKSFSIRKKNKDRKMINYGTYKCKKYAEEVRDQLIKHDWDKSRLDEIQMVAQKIMNEKAKKEVEKCMKEYHI